MRELVRLVQDEQVEAPPVPALDRLCQWIAAWFGDGLKERGIAPPLVVPAGDRRQEPHRFIQKL